MRRDGLTRLLALACALAPVVTLRALPGLSPPTLTAPTPVRAAAHPHCLAAVERQDLDSPIGALVDAISNSKSGAVNKMLTDAPSSKAVLELVSAYVERLNPVNVATALHRIAVLDKRNRVERDSTINDRRFDALMEKVIEHCPNLTPRATADIFWSCATLKHWPALLLKPLLTRLAAHLEAEALEPHHFSLIAWALATLECKPVVLLERIQTQASTLANSFSSQNCANILWGFAKLRQPAPELLSAVSTRLVEGGLIERAKPVEVSDLSFALAMLAEGEEEREAAVPLLRALAQRARADADLGAFSSRQLVTLVWAHARLSSQPPAAELSAWLESVREANERRPLMDADRNNLKRSLQLFDLSEIHVEWLIPPKVAESEAPAVRVSAAERIDQLLDKGA